MMVGVGLDMRRIVQRSAGEARYHENSINSVLMHDTNCDLFASHNPQGQLPIPSFTFSLIESRFSAFFGRFN